MLGLLLAAPGVASVWNAVGAVIGFIGRCTVCMIAIAIGVAWIAGDIHGRHKDSAEWSAKWDAAEAQAELDRQKRDAFAKAKIEADANDRLAGVSARAETLEAKVEKYEKDDALRRATGAGGAAINSCLTDKSDDQWLHELQRERKVKSPARSGFAERLRALGGRSSDPGKSGR